MQKNKNPVKPEKAAKPRKPSPKKVAKAEKPKAAKEERRPEPTEKNRQSADGSFDALILSFRRGRHTMTGNQMLLGLEGVDTKAKASQFIGKKLVWTSPGRNAKKIYGKITNTHGRNGVLRARFSRGLPGTAIGTSVKVLG